MGCVDVLNFGEWSSEEVVGFFWRSVWMILILMRFLMYICYTVFGSIFIMHKIAHVALAFAPFCIFLYFIYRYTSEHGGIMASSLKEKKNKKRTTYFNCVLMFPLYALVV